VLVLGLFVPAFALAVVFRDRDRETIGRALRVSGWALLGASTAIAFFYSQYVPELLPGLTSQGSPTVPTGTLIDLRLTPLAALQMSVHRLFLFYGPLFGTLVFTGMFFMKGRLTNRLAFPLACGTLCAFFGLNFLRSGLGATHIFQFTKDDLVLLPLATIVLGNLTDISANRKRWGRPVAAALVAGWIGWGCFALAGDVRARFIRPDYPPVDSAETLVPNLLSYRETKWH
jgi:hypothetical protein